MGGRTSGCRASSSGERIGESTITAPPSVSPYWDATLHCHKAAEAMAYDEGALAQLGSGNHGADFLDAKLGVVVRSPVAVAHPGQINHRDAKVADEVRRNVAPPVAMRTAAMNEEKATLVRPHRRARPNQVMDPTTRYRHELRLAGVGNGPPKPVRRRRTDRKEIGGHGLAAQVMHHALYHPPPNP